MPFLNISDSDGVVTLTMSQPATRNALSENSAVDEFREACARINADRAAKVVIIAGEGPVFSSGG
ncbi:MAG: enoyl-CoA hydratase-related protein, partial [Methylibium sp.]